MRAVRPLCAQVKELVLRHDHRRLEQLPVLYRKFKGDEARLLTLATQLYVDGDEAVRPLLDIHYSSAAGTEVGDGAAGDSGGEAKENGETHGFEQGEGVLREVIADGESCKDALPGQLDPIAGLVDRPARADNKLHPK